MEPKEIVFTVLVAVLSSLGTLIIKDVYESAKNKSPHKKVQSLEEKVDQMSSDMEILKDAGKISAEIAKEYAENEFEKYRVIQDRLFKSDFDKQIELFNEEDKQ
jgi:hypothetical protein